MAAGAWLACALGMACGPRMEPGADCPPPAAPVTYAAAAKMLQYNCTSCHNAAAANRAGAPIGINYDTYQSARLFGEMGSEDAVSGRMPPNSPLDPHTACILYNWVRGGYLR